MAAASYTQEDWIQLKVACDSPKITYIQLSRMGTVDLETIQTPDDARRTCINQFRMTTKDCQRCLMYKRAARDQAGQQMQH